MPIISLTVKFAPLFLLVLLLADTSGATEVGLASVDIEPPIGTPLAGYGAKERRLPAFLDWGDRLEYASLFRPSTGRHTPIRSKAMVVRDGDSQVVFISLDLVGVEKRFVADLARRLAPIGIAAEQLIVGATHTHSGPGTISKRASMALVAVDRFRPENYELLLSKVAQSVHMAIANLEPAQLVATEFRTSGIQRNKWRHKDKEHYDNRARFLLARAASDGRLLGGFLNYALHGNGMPVADLRFSWDTPGSLAFHAERMIDRHNGAGVERSVVLYMNGAEGDVGNAERSVEAVTKHGEMFVAQAEAAKIFDNARPVDGPISVDRKKVWLGLPGYPAGICTGSNTPREDRGVDVRIPLWLMQQRTFVSVVRIGSETFLTWPGEASAQVGYDTQAMVASLGFDDAWFLGLANDYQSYFTTETEYHEGVYDSCSSLFRWKGAERIQRALTELLTQE